MKQETPIIKRTSKKATNSQKKDKRSEVVEEPPIRPDVNFISEGSSPHTNLTHVFLNKLNEQQREYIQALIEKRIERDRLKSEYIVAALAEAFKYRVYNAQEAGRLFLELSATILYNRSIFERQFGEYHFKELINYLKSISSFLSLREENYDGVLFDYWKVVNTSKLHLGDAMELQHEHAERQVVDDGVWLFDMHFKVCFKDLSEEEKVDRVKIFFEKWIDWHGEDDNNPFTLPAYVKKYIPKAMALINKSANL